MLDNIENGQESTRETEKLAETVETKVDQITSQIHHLEGRSETNRPVMMRCKKKKTEKKKTAACLQSCSFYLQCELILVFVPKWKRLTDHISEVFLHKLHGGSKLPLHLLSGGVGGFVLEPAAERTQFTSGPVAPCPHTGQHLLLYCDFGGDLGPEARVSNGNHGLLRVPVHVHVQHEAAEGGPEVVGQAVIKHAAQDQIHGKLAGDLVDGQILAVQTHFGKQV